MESTKQGEANSPSQRDFDLIVAAFKARKDFDSDKLLKAVLTVAEIYHYRRSRSQYVPSKMAPRLKTLVGRLTLAKNSLTAALNDEQINHTLEWAAHLLNEQGNSPPVMAGQIRLDGKNPRFGWPVALQIEKSAETAAWLATCARNALELVQGEKRLAGGKRSDKAKNELFRGLIELYAKAAAKPRRPYWDNKNEVPKGELILFLFHVLQWMKERHTTDAIYSRCRAVIPTTSLRPRKSRKRYTNRS